MKFSKFALMATIGLFSINSHAAIIVPGSWTTMANDDGHVGPGSGAQYYDAEYLLYNWDSTSNVLQLALQTGFDIEDNAHGGFISGDLALSFDSDDSTYEYGIKFGALGTSTLNSASDWTAPVYSGHSQAGPINMINPSPLLGGANVETGHGSGATWDATHGDGISYYRTFSFDVDDLNLLGDIHEFDAHWAMSCGNDFIEGSANVPEPSILALFAAGLFGIGFARRRKC